MLELWSTFFHDGKQNKLLLKQKYDSLHYLKIQINKLNGKLLYQLIQECLVEHKLW